MKPYTDRVKLGRVLEPLGWTQNPTRGRSFFARNTWMKSQNGRVVRVALGDSHDRLVHVEVPLPGGGGRVIALAAEHGRGWPARMAKTIDTAANLYLTGLPTSPEPS